MTVPKIMNTDFLDTACFASSFHLMVQVIFCHNVVIFSLSVVQFALQFFYFNGQYEFFFSLRSPFGCDVNIYISIRKHFSAPEAIIFSKSIDMNQAFVIMLAVSNLKNHGGPVYAT